MPVSTLRQYPPPRPSGRWFMGVQGTYLTSHRRAHCSDLFVQCYIGNHGLVGVSDGGGRVELRTRTLIHPQRRILCSARRCSHLRCYKKSNKSCSRQLCRAHCLPNPVSCGIDHDNIRRQLARAAAEDSDGSLAPARADRNASHVDRDVRAYDGPAWGTQHDHVHGSTIVQLYFSDRVRRKRFLFGCSCAKPQQKLVVQSRATTVYNGVTLATQSDLVKENLRLHEAEPQTLEYITDRGWQLLDISSSTPVTSSMLRCRARTKRGISIPFPSHYYGEMAPRLAAFHDFLGNDMPEDQAFELAFGALTSDLDLVRLCHTIWTSTPVKIKQQFQAAERSGESTWSSFVHASQSAGTDPFAALPGAARSVSPPPAHRPAWRGPSPSNAGSSRTAQHQSPARFPSPLRHPDASPSPAPDAGASPEADDGFYPELDFSRWFEEANERYGPKD